MDAMQQGLERCPFLREVAQREGQGFAAHIACRPTVPYGRLAGPVLREDACDFAATFELFHGPAGVVPLRAASLSAGAGCPFHAASTGAQSVSRTFATAASPAAVRPPARAPVQQLSPFAGTPMASLSLSFGLPSGFGDWWAQRKPGRRQRRQQQRQQGSGQTSRGGAGNGTSAVASSSSSSSAQARARFGSGKLRNSGRFRSGKFSNSGLAKRLGGLLALGAQQELKCPAAVVAARAAIARLKPVRVLRPQTLPVKLLAIGAFTGVANAPSGAAREHTRKFSPEWFLAVHATIPFIAMLRKAVVMPKWAMAWTIACAVIGQVIGSRLERARLQQQRHQKQLPAAPSLFPAAAAKRRVAGGNDSGAAATAASCAQSAAALQQRSESAWRQSFFVPAVC